MKLDLADWADAREKLILRLEAGAWRHGIKTKVAVAEVIRYGGFPADPNTMWIAKWKKKCGEFIRFGLYYYVQSGLKNRRREIVGKSGRKLRPRRIYCVENGVAEGEIDENGLPVRPEKEGLWMRREDMNTRDYRHARRAYVRRESDGTHDKVFLDTALGVLEKQRADVVAADVWDQIEAAL